MTTRMTKHGVRDLNSVGKRVKHTHRFVPDTRASPYGGHITKMVCFCGAVEAVPEEGYT